MTNITINKTKLIINLLELCREAEANKINHNENMNINFTIGVVESPLITFHSKTLFKKQLKVFISLKNSHYISSFQTEIYCSISQKYFCCKTYCKNIVNNYRQIYCARCVLLTRQFRKLKKSKFIAVVKDI